MSEEALPGGNTTGAVLIDGVVHKRAFPWTSTVHAVLRHLENAGFDAAPRALGFDDQGREMLTYLPGDTVGSSDPRPAWVSADAMLTQVGGWLRRVHDLTADFTPPPDERWFIGGTLRPGLIVGHQDASPDNAVVTGDRLVGFCDWDIAGPSTPEWDLAFSALTWVPLTAPQPGDDLPERSRRLHLLLDAYGYAAERTAFATVLPQRARRQAAVIRTMADAGDRAAVALLPIADLLDRSAAAIEALPGDFWTR
ncbi:phosphotransferase [Actinoplanes sp. N902-109]|uniref:phosphotransferase n=1 Tax=Actinoplanes sp. (strain N902-109) TaxID=649831 RepID=UPI000329403E|nr:phosphotransferase [Actinoplanes sp. N902-109]AGL17365.1 aminoglycoside phosphotransferase [Actinoplanes sp. N902-109]